MLPRNDPDRIHVAFDYHRLVANVGLLLPVTLAYHLGLGTLVDHYVGLGDTPGRANAGDKMLTLVASALAGGDCIDDADSRRRNVRTRNHHSVSVALRTHQGGAGRPRRSYHEASRETPIRNWRLDAAQRQRLHWNRPASDHSNDLP